MAGCKLVFLSSKLITLIESYLETPEDMVEHLNGPNGRCGIYLIINRLTVSQLRLIVCGAAKEDSLGNHLIRNLGNGTSG